MHGSGGRGAPPAQPARGAKRVGAAVKKADQGLDKVFDKVDAMGAAAFGRLSRGGGAAQEYRKV